MSYSQNSPFLQFTKETVPPAYQNNPASYPATMIAKGALVYKSIQRGNAARLQQNMDQYMQSIIALMFYLYSKAVEKNQAFSSGAFVIKDPDFKVFNFLYAYVEKKWKPKNMFKEINVDISGIGAYPRQSTHLNDYYKYTDKVEKGWIGTSKKKEFTHYGIDLPKGYLMPAGKRHILFAKEETKPPLTYIKLESHGLGLSGVVQHAGELVKVKTGRLVSKVEKKLKKLNFKEDSRFNKLMKQVSGSLGSDDSPEYRREKVPAEPVIMFFALLLSDGTPVKEGEIETKRVKALGLQAINVLLDTFIRAPQASKAWKQEAQNFLNQLRNEYDHLDVRIGREVILTPDRELRIP